MLGVRAPLSDLLALLLGRDVMDSEGGIDLEGLGVVPPPPVPPLGVEAMESDAPKEEGEGVFDREGRAGVEVGVEDPEVLDPPPPPPSPSNETVAWGVGVGLPLAWGGVGVGEEDRVKEEEEEGVEVRVDAPPTPPPALPVGKGAVGEGEGDGEGEMVVDGDTGAVWG
jgi:hypothetical protein